MSMRKEEKFHPFNFVMIALGAAVYSFGFVNFNMANSLAEGGGSGLTLIVHALFGINPAYTQIAINIPLFILGAKIFGRRALIYTFFGTFSLSFFIWFFQLTRFNINIEHDNLIAALLAGIFAGIGSGLVFRWGGTTGGADIVARIAESKWGWQMGQTLLLIDVIVLGLSLSYIDIRHMMYTLIASFVFSQVVVVVQTGGYTARGMFIITKQPELVAQKILEEVERGATFLSSQGAYTGQASKTLYVILNPREVLEVKQLLDEIDPSAFVSVINVHEVIGAGFTYPLENAVPPKKD